jgi:hypothetical protein
MGGGIMTLSARPRGQRGGHHADKVGFCMSGWDTLSAIVLTFVLPLITTYKTEVSRETDRGYGDSNTFVRFVRVFLQIQAKNSVFSVRVTLKGVILLFLARNPADKADKVKHVNPRTQNGQSR